MDTGKHPAQTSEIGERVIRHSSSANTRVAGRRGMGMTALVGMLGRACLCVRAAVGHLTPSAWYSLKLTNCSSVS